MKKSKVSHPLPGPGSAPLVKTEVQTKENVEQAKQVHALALDIVKATGELAGKYLTLCLYIRSNKVAPRLVSTELGRIGFKRSRISEINRVSNASDKLFSEYQAKMIGFEKCLDLARMEVAGEPKLLTEGAKVLAAEGSLTDADTAEASKDDEPSGGGRAGSGPTTFEQVTQLADKIIVLAPLLRKNKFPFERATGQFKVTLTKL